MEGTPKQKLVKGLTSTPKYIPTWYNYDELGSELGDKCIIENPGYYLTQSQTSILETHIQELIPDVTYDFSLIDLGSGNCLKSRYFLDELLKRQTRLTFYPLDISEDFLLKTVDKLSKEYGDNLTIVPIAADYDTGIKTLRNAHGPKLVLWFGSILNLSYEDQIDTLTSISTLMSKECHLVFSFDVTQDEQAVLKAYDDEAGLERTFFLNCISRLNKEEGSQLDLDSLQYKVDFVSNASPDYMSYFRAYIEAKDDYQCTIPGLGVDLVFQKGERLYLFEGDGLSCKYTKPQIKTLTEKAGLQLTETWTDDQQHAMFCRCVVI